MAVLAAVALLVGCATGGMLGRGSEPLRLSDVQGEGDATRRASLRLCTDGLDADAAGRPASARGLYDRAIQIDPPNPYAYLVLARHELDAGDPQRALEYLDQAERLLGSEDALTPKVEPHLVGLRGAALQMTGRGGEAELALARERAPGVWDDERLDAAELR
jgi:tetratricopeptide (TPR) repeat protein